jgi:YD repeat-containing protein
MRCQTSTAQGWRLEAVLRAQTRKQQRQTCDNIGQLKIADGSVSSHDRGYTYNAAWNLNYRTNNGGVTTFSVNRKNEITSGPDSTYTYDPKGNLTNYYSTYPTYTYDDENQLTRWEHIQTARTEYLYDGRGRLRVRKDYSYNWGGG